MRIVGHNGPVTGPAILFESVTKRYRRTGAGIVDVSFDVRPGEIVGFLGPNGAGKSTAIRVLLDLLRADAGRVTVLGLDSRADSVAVRRRLGYLPGELELYERLTGRDLLGHFAHLRGGAGRDDIEILADRFGLSLDRPIRTLSKGNKQKIGLVQAFMGAPDVLVLDEPTSGLDPLVQKAVHDHLRACATDGTAVMFSSHSLGEVAAVADRVAMIREGEIAAVDDVETLRSRAVHRLEAHFAADLPEGCFEGLESISHLEVTGNVARMQLAGSIDPVIKALATFEVTSLVAAEPSLEDVFFGYYEKGSQ